MAKMAKMGKKYTPGFRDKLKTGDIILFSGKGGISAGIKWATLSRWSHVGMILVLPEYDFVCLWESAAAAAVQDLDTNKLTKGVQLVPLSARIQQYEGEIALRPLVGDALPDSATKRLMELRRRLAGVPYEEDFLELVKAAYEGPGGHNTEDLSSLFCSELVAEAYQCLGLVKETKPSNEYTPADFSAKDEDIRWKGASPRLGQEVLLKT